jgi:putative ABC transport system permease protein
MNTFLQDLRYSARMLLKKPGFTSIVALTLALGIGANTAIFSVLNGVLLKPLPFNEPERVVMVWNRMTEAAGGDRTPLAVSDLLDWRAQSRSFESVGAFRDQFVNYIGGATPERVRGAGVTANFFSILGVQAALGRAFLPGEDLPGAQRVALISDTFWRTHFAADPQVIGRSINLSGVSFSIVGVAPAALNFPNKEVEVWTALQLQQPTKRGPYFLGGVARLRPGVSLEHARVEANTLRSSLENQQFNFNIIPVNEYIVGDVRAALLTLLIAALLVLLIAVANVANLSLVRAAERVKEISIRTALGESRGRAVRQLLTESVLLALVGGALGTFCAFWCVKLLLQLAPGDLPRSDQIGIDANVLGVTALISLLTGVVFGLAPIWQSSRLNINAVLKEGGRGNSESASRKRWRNMLVISELALAAMLLIGAGLLVKSLWRLLHVDTGANAERVLTMQLALRGTRYTGPLQVESFYSRLLELVAPLPGVRAAAISNSLPPNNHDESDDFAIEGRPVAPEQALPIAYMIRVSPDYFRLLEIPLRRGRYFTTADSANAPLVAVISETTARQFFPNEDPIGKRINLVDAGEPIWWNIIGVVGDVKYNGLARKTEPAVYQPVIQASSSSGFFIVKTDIANPLALTASVRSQINSLDSELPISQVSTLEQRMADSVAQPRFRTTLVALFAALALILACIGIYGVISYSVAQRTHEIGIRIALGAQRGDVLKMILKQGVKLALIGVGIGMSAAVALTWLMNTLLFDVKATDPMAFVTTALLLAGTVLLACWLPARRATKVDPLVALRHE